MKPIRCIALLATLLLPATLLAQTKNFNRTVEFAPGGTLRVNTDVGSLRMTAWERQEVEVIARIIGRADDDASAEEMQRSVEMTQIEITGGDGSPLTIKANYDGVNSGNRPVWMGWNRRLPRIEWEIRAPRQINLELDVDRSEAEVRGFAGRHRLHSDRTALRIEDLAGDIRLEIDRGRETQLGRVRGTLAIVSDRTNLTLTQTQLTGDSSLQVGRGKLEMQLAGAPGLSLNVNRERRSTFKSDFPLAANTSSDDKIEGTINGGGPRLSVQTDRAQVHLRNN